MSQNKKIIDEFIEFIESSINDNLDETDFIKKFRQRIENYLKEKLS